MYSQLIRAFSTLKREDKIMFFGSSVVAFPSLKNILPHFPNLQVITHYSNPKRKLTNQVQIFCRQQSLPFQTPIRQHIDKEKRNQQWSVFSDSLLTKPKLGIICSYGFLIPSKIIDLFQMGLIVVHPSILPKYKGGAPIFHAIANGQKESGVSFIEISKDKFDFGNILHQVKTPLSDTQTYSDVQKNLANLCGQNIVWVLQNLQKLRPGIPQQSLQKQVAQQLRKAPIIRDKRLNLQRKAEQVYHWSRALRTGKVKFGQMQIMVYFENVMEQDVENEYEVGRVVIKGKRVFVKCLDKLLKLRSWQQATKNELAIHTFVNRFNADKKKIIYFR